MSNEIIQSMLRVAQKTMETAQVLGFHKGKDIYSDGHKVERVAKALEAIEKIALHSGHQKVEFKIYCYANDPTPGTVVDFQIDGHDSQGHVTDILGDLNFSSFTDALLSMGEDKEIQRLIDQINQGEAANV